MLDFNVSLDHIAWIQVANGLKILFKCQIILFLDTVQLISMFFTDLSIDFLWEISTDSNALGLRKHAFLEEVLNLKIMFHFGKLVDSKLACFVSHLHEDGIFLDFDLEDFWI